MGKGKKQRRSEAGKFKSSSWENKKAKNLKTDDEYLGTML